jgi:signal transduction histidine kinase
MSELQSPTETARFVADLRKIQVFVDLPDDEIEWVAQRMDEVKYPAGFIYGRPGDPIDYMIVLLEGETQFGRPDVLGGPVLTATAGEVTGTLPFSRLTHFRGIARTVLASRALMLHKKYFPDMLQRSPLLGQRLVALMSDRIRDITRMETQQDKLAALGKLSAGLAHELNNPAAAARRAAQSLTGAMDNVRSASIKFLQQPVSDPQRDAILQFERDAAKNATSRTGAPLDPLERSDREDALTTWLEEHDVKEPWNIAPMLAEAEVTPEKLETLVAITGTPILAPALKRIASIVTIFGLIQEIDNTTRRITDLVTAIKRYSYMDQSALQEIDLHEDLENTLKIFGHRLKYAPDLPRVCGYGGELNQVWTNLIDNAIDAMNGKGELTVYTSREFDNAIVEIGDNGPGVAPEIQSRIFDPFFTTKKVGEGTGLGLDTVMRIIRKHHSSIELRSKPGNTCFRVRLPLKQPQFPNVHQEKTDELNA